MLSSLLFCLVASFVPFNLGFRSMLWRYPLTTSFKRTQSWVNAVSSTSVDHPVDAEHFMKFAETPKVLFYLRDDRNIYQNMCSKDGLIYPIISLNPSIAMNGVTLHPDEYVEFLLTLHKRVYVIPKGTIIPDTMALLQDKRGHCDQSPYELVIREPCSPEMFENNIDEFILDGGLRLCFECVNYPKH